MGRLLGAESNYDYVCARVRGMGSRLLSSADVRELGIRCPSLELLSSALEKTDYGLEIELNSIRDFPDALAFLEVSISQSVGRFIRKVHSLGVGETRDLLGIYLLWGDLHNLRICLRQLASGSREGFSLKGLEFWSEAPTSFYEELLSAEGISRARDLAISLGSPISQAFVEAVSVLERTKSLASAERRLFLSYREEVEGRLSLYSSYSARRVREAVGVYLDVMNVVAFMRLGAGRSGRGEDLFLGDGLFLDAKRWRAALEKGMGALVVGTPYESLVVFGDPLASERKLERYFLERMCSMYRGDPISVDVPWGYMSLKRREGMNLRILAVGIYFGRPLEEVFAKFV